MNIVILTSIYPPEPIVGAQTACSLAQELAARGHRVTVVTSFPSRPGGKLYPGFKRSLFQKSRDAAGFEVVRCFSVPSPKSTLVSRFAENITFGLTAALYLLFLRGVDVVYSNTWFIFATGLMSLCMRARRIPYLIRVTDLYPESMVSQQRMKPGSLLYRLFWRIDQWIAAGAAGVAVLTPHFAQTYIQDRRITASKIAVIPDWVSGDSERVREDESAAIRQQFGIAPGAFLAAFGGNIGVAAGVDTLVNAAALSPDVQFLIAGDGSTLSDCQQLASRVAPHNVSFFSPWPKDKTMALYQAADVLVLPTRGEQSVASIPSKMIRYMLSGRPVIAASLPGTELASMVQQTQCGWLIPPDDPHSLAQALAQAKTTSRQERDRRGLSGRDYALKTFGKETNLPRIVRILEQKSVQAEGGTDEH